jgi:hypothetical protein
MRRSTRATKKSIFNDCDLKKVCSYKTFVVSINRMGLAALRILFYLMRQPPPMSCAAARLAALPSAVQRPRRLGLPVDQFRFRRFR